jgi:hypothetical protein
LKYKQNDLILTFNLARTFNFEISHLFLLSLSNLVCSPCFSALICSYLKKISYFKHFKIKNKTHSYIYLNKIMVCWYVINHSLIHSTQSLVKTITKCLYCSNTKIKLFELVKLVKNGIIYLDRSHFWFQHHSEYALLQLGPVFLALVGSLSNFEK